MTLLGNPTRKRGIMRMFLAYASGHQVFKQQFVLAALAYRVDLVVESVFVLWDPLPVADWSSTTKQGRLN